MAAYQSALPRSDWITSIRNAYSVLMASAVRWATRLGSMGR